MRAPWLSLSLFLGLTGVAQAYPRLKFRHWFPRYEQHWINASASCQPQLTDYYENNRTQCRVPCACAADCLLQDIPATIQSNFASAQVILGLLPPTLVFLGPTLAEVAALSTYMPFLAILLALGSPAVHVNRVFHHVDVQEPFARPMSRTSRLWSVWLARQNVFLRSSFRGLSYLVAFAAIANNVWTSIYLDFRTVSGWRCGTLFMPLIWGQFAVVVHAWGMFAVRVHIRGGYKPSIKYIIKSTTFQAALKGQDKVLSQAILWLATLFVIFHMMLGVLVLSSLIFISALEAVSIFCRYALSVVVCQLILSMELANMRFELGQVVESTTGHTSDR